MERVTGEVRAPGGINGSGSIYLINHNADNALVTLRYRLKDAAIEAAEEPFEAAGRKVQSRLVHYSQSVGRRACRQAAAELGIQVYAVADAPSVKTHPVKAARIAMMHTWLSTQDEGWWRLAFDQLQSAVTTTSARRTSRKDANLKAKYDVIIFAPVGRGARCDHQRHADVRKSAAVEDDCADSQPRQD